jgi:hypothetical protein
MIILILMIILMATLTKIHTVSTKNIPEDKYVRRYLYIIKVLFIPTDGPMSFLKKQY